MPNQFNVETKPHSQALNITNFQDHAVTYQIAPMQEELFDAEPVSSNVIAVEKYEVTIPAHETARVAFQAKDLKQHATYFFLIKEPESKTATALSMSGKTLQTHQFDGDVTKMLANRD